MSGVIDLCFYCNRTLRHLPGPRYYKNSPPDRLTKDHIFPQSALRSFGNRVPATFRRFNVVACCHECNHAKGSIDPIYWAQKCGPAAVVRLALRMRQMGVPPDYVALLRSGAAVLTIVAEGKAA